MSNLRYMDVSSHPVIAEAGYFFNLKKNSSEGPLERGKLLPFQGGPYYQTRESFSKLHSVGYVLLAATFATIS